MLSAIDKFIYTEAHKPIQHKIQLTPLQKQTQEYVNQGMESWDIAKKEGILQSTAHSRIVNLKEAIRRQQL